MCYVFITKSKILCRHFSRQKPLVNNAIWNVLLRARHCVLWQLISKYASGPERKIINKQRGRARIVYTSWRLGVRASAGWKKPTATHPSHCNRPCHAINLSIFAVQKSWLISKSMEAQGKESPLREKRHGTGRLGSFSSLWLAGAPLPLWFISGPDWEGVPRGLPPSPARSHHYDHNLYLHGQSRHNNNNWQPSRLPSAARGSTTTCLCVCSHRGRLQIATHMPAAPPADCVWAIARRSTHPPIDAERATEL